jgi:hypothetical protein
VCRAARNRVAAITLRASNVVHFSEVGVERASHCEPRWRLGA